MKPSYHKQDNELLGYLDDKFEREQLAVRMKKIESRMEFNEVKVFWHNDIEGYINDAAVINDEKAFDGDFMCSEIQFSRTGKYLVSYTISGVTIYGGADMNPLAAYRHPKVSEVKFSPDDSYMATFSGLSSDKAKTSENMIVWNVRTGVKLKVFTCPKKSVFDLFDWSFDEKYCATIIETTEKPLLYSYNSSDMSLTEYETSEKGKTTKKKGPIDVEYPRNLKWANKRNTLCFVCYSDDNAHSKPLIGCIDIPSRIEFRWMDVTVKLTHSEVKWEESDRFLSIYLITTSKKDTEHLIQVGILPKVTPAAIISKPLCQVKSMSFKDKEKSVLKSFGFDNSGRNFFITYQGKQGKVMLDYFSIVFDKVLLLAKEDTIENFEFASVVFSNIENLCLFQTRGEIAFVQLKNSNERFKLKQTGEIKRMPVSNLVYIAYDNSGRNVMIFDKITMKLNIYSAYGQEKANIMLDNALQCAWRPIKRIPIDDSVVSNLQKDLKKPLIDKFGKEDDERIEDYQNAHNKEKKVKTEQVSSTLHSS